MQPGRYHTARDKRRGGYSWRAKSKLGGLTISGHAGTYEAAISAAKAAACGPANTDGISASAKRQSIINGLLR